MPVLCRLTRVGAAVHGAAPVFVLVAVGGCCKLCPAWVLPVATHVHVGNASFCPWKAPGIFSVNKNQKLHKDQVGVATFKRCSAWCFCA